MSRAIALFNTFVSCAIASSFLCWIASLNSGLQILVRALYLVVVLCWILGWILDDWLCLKFRITLLDLQGILVAGIVAVLFGLGVMLCRF
ncbi:hypothetical protein [Microcoleus sp. CAWBG640]|uniref:hypothetical protein n=1 Tax=Microcoleus sp. CAWBG640 TaxID=2841653 RepID=UPI00312B4B7D